MGLAIYFELREQGIGSKFSEKANCIFIKNKRLCLSEYMIKTPAKRPLPSFGFARMPPSQGKDWPNPLLGGVPDEVDGVGFAF